MSQKPRSTPAAAPEDGRSLADKAYQRLRLEIVECLLAPKQRLTEATVAQQLEVGRMPAREALLRLVSEGLIQVIPRHGYAVAPITLRDVRELFELRLVIEPAAVERAVGHFDAAQHTQLKKLSEVGYRAAGRESVRRYLRANTELHTRIARLSGNRRIADLVASILLESERLINFILPTHPQSDQTADEHRRLLEAMAEGDATQARRIAEGHIRATRQMVVESLLSDGHFEGDPIRA